MPKVSILALILEANLELCQTFQDGALYENS